MMSSRGLTYSTLGTGSFEHSIAPQSGFKSGHLSTLPFTTQIYSHDSPLQTLPWSPLWHFQVFTVVTNIEGKQQTEPLPVSASHWETNLKHQEELLSWLSGQSNSDWTIQWFLGFVITTLNREHLRNNNLKKKNKKWKC